MQKIKQEFKEAIDRIIIAEERNSPSLDLSMLNLEILPAQLEKANLSNLKSINLSRNSLKEFPNEISKFSNITFLDLSHNLISEIDDSIKNLTKLETLWVFKNNLILFPETITNIKSLKYLSLANNRLINISNKIDRLQKLEALYLNENYIMELPVELKNMDRLIGLFVYDNPAVYKNKNGVCDFVGRVNIENYINKDYKRYKINEKYLHIEKLIEDNYTNIISLETKVLREITNLIKDLSALVDSMIQYRNDIFKHDKNVIKYKIDDRLKKVFVLIGLNRDNHLKDAEISSLLHTTNSTIRGYRKELRTIFNVTKENPKDDEYKIAKEIRNLVSF